MVTMEFWSRSMSTKRYMVKDGKIKKKTSKDCKGNIYQYYVFFSPLTIARKARDSVIVRQML